MVKANAYGHGLDSVVEILDEKVDSFGVVDIQEAIRVRKLSKKPILLVSRAEDLRECRQNDLDIIIESSADLKRAMKFGMQNNLHLKIDCGMHRYGTNSCQELKKINDILFEKDIKLKSICTHFSHTSNKEKTNLQYKNFLSLKDNISQDAPICFGGSGVFDYNFDYDILRLGIGLYGYGQEDLKKTMKICSYVSKIFFAKAGEFVGYDEKGKVEEDGYYAVVPVGYADGLRRCLANNFAVKINGKSYLAFGNICMDCFFVKIDKTVKVGDVVVVLGDAEAFAKKVNTISYEILTGFSNFRGKTIVK